ncbi:ABC transporter G family member 20 [Tribolium castaneum]|uniref:ABC transporter G family member 23-like Protein n=1 Tax=Tribolium castaneum TaxID=7070 RepID=D6X2Z9_TRICA|nr:PREDICTED: ABC transporter G family member 20 [Tribolium castaneum]EFA10297.1 ABC transporter G family member 23-like Protein [Tribolium castaneum]|eukprot:XP_967359.1 PREDICTED: ABC transporter G family member 20 [Tribolium castaneum]
MPEGPSDLELRRRQFKAQMSTVQTRRQQAVCVRRAYKRYGTKSNPYVILDGLNMTVPKGAIYGLLGASGCGKTTLLNCIVGRKRLNSGEIWVLGGTPGSRGSGVPGPRVGYMPQEIALYGEFTIRETLKYFGWISGMTTQQVEDKLGFLVSFLMLPDADRLVKNLSGGQQRRVSLAATLIHEPELLILDEPTVGVDPLLRQNIWNHLVEITKHGRTTVIITTHYIDETRQAHLIGLMRGGYFLAEESPERLISQFGAESLEDVFLKLSVIQNMGKRRRSSILQGVTETIQVPSGTINEAAVIDDEVGEISGEFGDNVSMSSRGGRVSIAPEPTENAPPELPPEEEPPMTFADYFKIVKLNHMRALIWKNFLWMWRNAPVMAFIIGLPVVQTILFCLSIGHDPTGLPLTVVNYELDQSEVCKVTPGCNSTRLSCNYLHFLKNRTLELSFYENEEEGKEKVRHGKAWATLVFPSNFSDSLRSRINGGRSVPDWDLVTSSVAVYQDKSNENIGSYIQRDLYFAFEDFFKDYLSSCNIDTKVGTIPIRWETPVYGYGNPDFTDFAAPGVILTIIFFLAVALTSGAMLLERNEGILERSLVNGISGIELLSSHVITQFAVMFGQSAMVLIFSFYIFGITQNGNLLLVIILIVITGLCGMCFGFVVACSCDNERSATYMAMGSFLPIVMLCGIIWPIEAMHSILQWISYVLPLTKSTESLRCILARGWGIGTTEVYAGFVSTLIWIVVFLTISILLLKFKKG